MLNLTDCKQKIMTFVYFYQYVKRSKDREIVLLKLLKFAEKCHIQFVSVEEALINEQGCSNFFRLYMWFYVPKTIIHFYIPIFQSLFIP